jgi:acetyltransferase-like isoleucine patch superfamily enzyme
MGYLSKTELENYGFKHLGENVRISDKASLDKPELMSFGDNSRVDDFCALSGHVSVERNVHIAVHCSITASRERIVLSEFSGLAFSCHLFSSSDDYSGMTLTNPTVPTEYKNINHGAIVVGRHVILGTGTLVFPGVHVADGCATGALTVLNKSTEEWGIYVGSPGRRVKERSKELLKLEKEYLSREKK